MKSHLRIESFRRGVVYSTALNIGARGLGFLTNIGIAHFFGALSGTDVYFFVLATVLVVVTFVTSVSSSVVIPESMRLLAQEGHEAAEGFVNLFLYTFVAIGGMVSLLTAILPVPFFSIFSGFPVGVLAEHQTTLVAGFPLFTLMMTANLLLDVLASRQFFTLPMLASIANNLFVLAAILVFHASLGVYAALFGLTAAYLVQVVALVLMMRRGLHWNFGRVHWHMRPTARRNILYAQIGNVTSALSTYLPVVWISGLVAGSVAALNYGQRIADIPNSLLIVQVSAVVGIKFNDLYARGQFREIERVMMEVIGSLEFILFPAAIALMLLSTEVVQVVYAHGSFDAGAVAATSLVLRILALVVPLYLVSTVVSRLFMAAQKIRESVLYQVGFNAILLTATYFAVGWMGLVGYPVTLLAMHVVNILACDILVRRLVPGVRYRGVFRILGRNILQNAAPVAVTLLVAPALFGLPPLSRLLTIAVLYVVVFGIASLLINREELAATLASFRKVVQ